MKAIGGSAEELSQSRWSLLVHSRNPVVRVARAIIKAAWVYSISLMVMYCALFDPGAPAQALYRLGKLLSFQSGGPCSVACYDALEGASHSCVDDCDCGGLRTCSLFGYCTGSAGECGTSDCEGAWWRWSLKGSTSSPVGGEAPTVWTYQLSSSSFMTGYRDRYM